MGKILPFAREPFDPEALTLTTSAYDKTVAPSAVRELVKKNILPLMAEGKRPKMLYDRALASVGIPALVDRARPVNESSYNSIVSQKANDNG